MHFFSPTRSVSYMVFPSSYPSYVSFLSLRVLYLPSLSVFALFSFSLSEVPCCIHKASLILGGVSAVACSDRSVHSNLECLQSWTSPFPYISSISSSFWSPLFIRFSLPCCLGCSLTLHSLLCLFALDLPSFGLFVCYDSQQHVWDEDECVLGERWKEYVLACVMCVVRGKVSKKVWSLSVRQVRESIVCVWNEEEGSDSVLSGRVRDA